MDFANLPISEAAGEETHAIMGRESSRARPAQREWMACTAVLEQEEVIFNNFTDQQ